MRFSYHNAAKCSQTNVLQSPNSMPAKSLIYSIFNTASIKPNSYPSYSSTTWWCPPVCSWLSESPFLHRLLCIEWQPGSDTVLMTWSGDLWASWMSRSVRTTWCGRCYYDFSGGSRSCATGTACRLLHRRRWWRSCTRYSCRELELGWRRLLKDGKWKGLPPRNCR